MNTEEIKNMEENVNETVENAQETVAEAAEAVETKVEDVKEAVAEACETAEVKIKTAMPPQRARQRESFIPKVEAGRETNRQMDHGGRGQRHFFSESQVFRDVRHTSVAGGMLVPR